jgi:RND family efflux transporter MFP subunit
MHSNNKLIAVFGLLAFTTACQKEPQRAEAAAPRPVMVKVTSAAEVDWPSLYEATGTVRARTAAVISSRVMGYVRQVRVEPGDRVAAGQVLVVIDARDLDSAVRQAKAANTEAADASLELQNAVASARANLDLAEVTHRRMADLFDKKSISNQEFDESVAKLKVAQAAYEMAIAKRTQLASKIRQAEEAVQAAQITREYAEITAPFAGVVTEKRVDAGSLATPGAPLLTLEGAGSYRLEASVEEGLLPAARLGQVVTVNLDSLGQTVQGRLSEVVPSVDSSSRSSLVKIDLPRIPNLRSGIFGRAMFPRATRPVLVAPQDAVIDQGQLQSVMVIENGVAHARVVTSGERRGGAVEILSGLAAGEKIVSPRPKNLLDGSTVEIQP